MAKSVAKIQQRPVALLRLVAARLPGSVPDDSLVARVGGDEVTILLKGTLSQREAEDIAANVYGRVSDPYALDGETVHISTSIGIAFGDEGVDERELVRRADVAMYQAKARGRNGFSFYAPSMTGEGVERLRLETFLRRSIEKIGDAGQIPFDEAAWRLLLRAYA